MQIPFPSKGLSDLDAAARQMPLTTKVATNVTPVDPISGALTGAQREGMEQYSGDAVGAGTKVRLLADLVYDARLTTYTALGDSVTTDWSKTTPATNNVPNVVKDALGNVYALDGNAVVKWNADGAQVWKIALPSKDPNATVRALAVDDAGRVFAGTSAGSDVDKAGLWCYEQLEDGKTSLVWELLPGWYTEALTVSGLTLYAAQNNTQTWQSRMALYTGIGVPVPTLSREWPVAYPVNDADVSVKDGNVATTHEPLANRGFFPRSPETTAPWSDWTPRDLSNAERRLWSWHASDDADGDETFNASYEDGDTIDTIQDKTGNGRHWLARSPDTGGTLRKNVIAGRDSIFLNGTSNSYTSADPVSKEFQFRSLSKTVLPNYAKHQFAYFLAIRVPHDSTVRVSVARTVSNPTAGYDKEQIMYLGATFNAGSVTAPGNVFLYEESAGASGASGRASGGNSTTLPGAWDQDGLLIISWVFDHGYDDVTGTTTRSLLRVNGRPVDRWTSSTTFESDEPTTFGIAVYPNGTTNGTRMVGDFLEDVCVADWYETSTGSTSAYVQQRTITLPTYPDAVWSSGSTTELERFEGYLAHRWGAAHKLPTGHSALLQAAANANNNDTVTIDGDVYTFKGTLTAAANDVLIGASAFATLRNLSNAINRQGTPGTDYSAATVAHPTVWSPGVVENNGTSTRPMMYAQARDGNDAGFNVAESTAAARMDWVQNAGSTGATASATTKNGSGTSRGLYPHPYFLYRTTDSTGGPPSTTSSASLASGLASPYGILAEWDPANGKLKRILTTNGPGVPALPFGGVGYGVRYGNEGDIFVCGPRQAAVTNIGVSAENIDVRKLFYTANAWDASNTVNGSTATSCWTSAPGAFTYKYPRMAVDKWDNVYVPISASGISAKVYRRIAPTSSTDSALIYSVTSLTDDPAGYAIAVDRRWPDFPSAFTLPRAERFFLGTVKASSSNTVALYALREISAAGNNVSPRTVELVAVVGAGLYKVNSLASETTIDAAAFDSAARFIDSAAMNGARFFADGTRYYVYDPRNSIAGGYRARSSGQIPPRGMLMARFGSRIAIAGFADRRSGLAMSEYGDPYGWDFDPPGDSPLTVAAIDSQLSNLGDFPDVITCLCGWKDDLLMVGGDKSISMIRGDPAQGGRFDEIVAGIGVAFGRARCFTPDGTFWWVSNQGEFYRMVLGSGPELLSRHVQRSLSNSLNFSTARPELVYDPNSRCIRIVQVVNGSPSSLFTHWRYELDTGGLFQDTYGTTDVQPTAMCLVDGDSPNDRFMAVGGGDGMIRKFSRTAIDDDGVRIASVVRCHLPVDNESPGYARFTKLEIVTASNQFGAQYDFYTTEEPEDFGSAVVSGTLSAGSNKLARVRASGSFCAVDIRAADSNQRWGLQRITIDRQLIARVR